MKILLLIFSLILIPPLTQAKAQEILSEPVCFSVVNRAPYGVFGDVATDRTEYQGNAIETDIKISHTATFRLAEGESIPMCTTGPLFEGSKVRLTLRTLIPIFECKTMIYQGAEIIIRGQRNSDDGTTKTWAECF